MAARGKLERDENGRFVTTTEFYARLNVEYVRRKQRVDPARPTDAEILANPTDRFPRYRLRVFDTAWPWRASKGSAFTDALASGNARRDAEDRCLYLDACANIQRDPPMYLDRVRALERREARKRSEG